MKRRTTFVFLCFSFLLFGSAPPCIQARESSPRFVIGTGHAAAVEDLWLSADGKNLVSRSDDRILIRDTAARRALNVIESEDVYDVACSPGKSGTSF